MAYSGDITIGRIHGYIDETRSGMVLGQPPRFNVDFCAPLIRSRRHLTDRRFTCSALRAKFRPQGTQSELSHHENGHDDADRFSSSDQGRLGRVMTSR